MAELLLQQGYCVVGMVRRSILASYPRIEHIRHAIELAEGDLLDQDSLEELLRKYPRGWMTRLGLSFATACSKLQSRHHIASVELITAAVQALPDCPFALDLTAELCGQ